MVRKIGEIFEYKGEWYQCVEGDSCGECSFFDTACSSDTKDDNDDIIGVCSPARRDKAVIFKKLEKVGGYFYADDGKYQYYKVYSKHSSSQDKRVFPQGDSDMILVEIKQKQEDMEEKKINLNQEDLTYIIGKIRCDILPKYTTYDEITEEITRLFTPINGAIVSSSETTGKKLKPFDLEKAKAGNPVRTRDGRKARIIAFDRRLFYKNVSYPILALVERSDGEDDVCGYNEKGKVLIEDGAEYKDDLMMLPEKHEGWVNVYKVVNGHESGKIFATEEEAKTKANDGRVATIKIEWED